MSEKMDKDQARRTKAGAGSEFAVRLFQVLEAIALAGPVSVSDLAEKTGVPRVTVWRVAHILRERGWVRGRLADGRLELTPALDQLMGDAHFGLSEAAELDEVAALFSDFPGLTLCIGFFVLPGQFREIEATRRLALPDAPLSLVHDFQVKAALLSCTPAQRRRHADAYAKICPAPALPAPDGAAATHAAGPVVWAPDERQFAIPWTARSGANGAVRFIPRSATSAGLDALHRAAGFAANLLHDRIATVSGIY